MTNEPIVIIGGGLAGLIAAIHLKNNNHNVIVIEKNEFPKHKVCGEYISNEVLPYLESLGLQIKSLKPTKIDKLSFSLVDGKAINVELPLGGFGVSRYSLDQYLFNEATARGCKIVQETVNDINFAHNSFTIVTNLNSYKSSVVLGAFGKRSNLDVKLKRNFIQKKSHWLGVKAHYKLDYPDDLVGLHHFKGGYCGISKIENNLVNICYLSNYDNFKQFKSLTDYQNCVLSQNSHLKEIFDRAALQFEKPLTISQVSFEEKKTVDNHILMIGDTAGLIHPLCGNGMAMAIHSAKIASDLVIAFSTGKIKTRAQFEAQYLREWKYNFSKRLKIGRILASILQKEKLATLVLRMLIVFPFLLPIIIKNTHGKAIL
jgi:flavin-dependent dehydrogenase